MGSKPPQTRKGTQGFPFQTLPHRPERVSRKAAQLRLQIFYATKLWLFRKIKSFSVMLLKKTEVPDLEELHYNLRKLEQMCYRYDSICALVCLLKDALWQNEEVLNKQYTEGSAYISDQMIIFQTEFQELLEDLFATYKGLKNSK